MSKVVLEPGCINQDRLGFAAVTSPSDSREQGFSSCSCYISLWGRRGAPLFMALTLGPRLSIQLLPYLSPWQRGRKASGGSHTADDVLGLEVAHLTFAHNSLDQSCHMAPSKHRGQMDNPSMYPEGGELEIFDE